MSRFIVHKIICDQCKREIFIPIPPFVDLTRNCPLPAGWGDTGFADLCSDCMKRTTELADKVKKASGEYHA